MKRYSKYTAAVCLSLGFGMGTQLAQAQEKAAKEKPVEQKVVTLSIGDEIPKDLLAGVTWVQGAEVRSFDEKGKVYLIENWATWCGPCIKVIPHVNDLHKKYKDNGLVIVGMNVWEEGLDKVKDFVKKKGDGMAYPVAYSGGRDSTFVDKLLTPLGVTGIPQAVIVQNGKIMASIHPALIDDKLIEKLLRGDYDPAAEHKAKNEAAAKQAALMAKVRPMIQKKDWDGVKNLVIEMDDKERVKPMLLTKVAIAQSDWAGLSKLRKDAKSGRYGDRFSAMMIDLSVVQDAEVSEGSAGYAQIALADFQKSTWSSIPEAEKKFMNHFSKARLLFMTGSIEKSTAELEKAENFVQAMEVPEAKTYYGNLVKAAITKVAKGSFPKVRELR